MKYMPKEFILRKKCGFGLPIADWLRDKNVFLPRVYLLSKHTLIKKYFIKDEVDKLISEHLSRKTDHSSILFTIISLTVWYDTFISEQHLK